MTHCRVYHRKTHLWQPAVFIDKRTLTFTFALPCGPRHETNLPTIETDAQASAWISCADENQGRSSHPGSTPATRSQASAAQGRAKSLRQAHSGLIALGTPYATERRVLPVVASAVLADSISVQARAADRRNRLTRGIRRPLFRCLEHARPRRLRPPSK